MRTAFIALLLLSGFYLMTAEVVYGDGSFRVDLVVKPYPSLMIGAHVDPEIWQRNHPDEPLPWWQRGAFISVIQDDWEYGRPWWSAPYAFGFLIVLIAWPVLTGVQAARHLSRRRVTRRQ